MANDLGRNNSCRNDRVCSLDVAGGGGVEDESYSMPASWADYNRDGYMDLYVSYRLAAAGNRLTFQQAFKSDQPTRIREQMHHLARGYWLFENVGEKKLRDTSKMANVMMGRWSWGPRFVDLNNDGCEDLLVANGYLTRDDTCDV